MTIEGNKIMITGAGGFIGSHLADRLAPGNEVLVIDDFSIGSRDNLEQLSGCPNVRVVEADITDRARMHELTAGMDMVFHLAISCLRTSINQPQLSHDINAGGTLSVCQAALAHGVRRFVYVSSSEIYGSAQTVPMTESHPVNPTTVYGASKLAGELYALAYHRTYGLPVTVIRPFNTYGPREPSSGARAEVIPRFLLRLRAGEPLVIYGDGSQTRDFTYVADTVSGIVMAGECDELVGDVVNVAFGHEVSILEIARVLGKAAGVADPRIEHAPDRPGDVHRHYADITKARRTLGFAPTVSLEEGMSRTVAWFDAAGVAERADLAASGRPNW